MNEITAYIFDTETTGMDTPVMVESAILPMTFHKGLPFSAGEAAAARYNPGKPIEFGAMATHHIMDEDVAKCPSPDTFKLPDGIQYLVGHNIDYDWQVIGSPSGVKRICTLALARRLWPGVSHKQTALLYMLEPEKARVLARGAHAAGNDVEICAIILRHIVTKIGKPLDWEELYKISEDYRIPTHMPFGKHKDELISKIPSSYVSWLRKQDNVDPYLMAALDKYHV